MVLVVLEFLALLYQPQPQESQGPPALLWDLVALLLQCLLLALEVLMVQAVPEGLLIL